VLIGILSDTHGRVRPTVAAIDLLKQAGAEHYIHCGDVGAEEVLDLFAGLPLSFVWGNNDERRSSLGRYAQTLGLTCYGEFADLVLDDKRIAVTHGDDFGLLRRIISEAKHDYLLLGHTHVRRDERAGKLRIINPGALHRTPQRSVAVLNTATDELRFLKVDEPIG
jgi:putative phosphoesterase